MATTLQACIPDPFCCSAEAKFGGRELPLGTVVAVTIPRGMLPAVVNKNAQNMHK